MTLQGHTGGILALAFSPDGQMLATVSKDQTVKRWNLQGKNLQTLQGKETFNTVQFSPDGQYLATGSEDGTIRLWTLKGEVLQTLGGHSSGVKSINFTPDGQQLVSSDAMGNGILWNLALDSSPEQWLTQGCQWVRDYLKTNISVSSQDRHLCD